MTNNPQEKTMTEDADWTIQARHNGWTGWVKLTKEDNPIENSDLMVLNGLAVWTRDMPDGSPRHPNTVGR